MKHAREGVSATPRLNAVCTNTNGPFICSVDCSLIDRTDGEQWRSYVCCKLRVRLRPTQTGSSDLVWGMTGSMERWRSNNAMFKERKMWTTASVWQHFSWCALVRNEVFVMILLLNLKSDRWCEGWNKEFDEEERKRKIWIKDVIKRRKGERTRNVKRERQTAKEEIVCE